MPGVDKGQRLGLVTKPEVRQEVKPEVPKRPSKVNCRPEVGPEVTQEVTGSDTGSDKGSDRRRGWGLWEGAPEKCYCGLESAGVSRVSESLECCLP